MDDSQKDKNWKKIKLDLISSVSEWNELCKAAPTVSQDEKQLQEIKSLLEKLSDKINEFSL